MAAAPARPVRPLDDVYQRPSRSAFRQRKALDGGDCAYVQRRGAATGRARRQAHEVVT